MFLIKTFFIQIIPIQVDFFFLSNVFWPRFLFWGLVGRPPEIRNGDRLGLSAGTRASNQSRGSRQECVEDKHLASAVHQRTSGNSTCILILQYTVRVVRLLSHPRRPNLVRPGNALKWSSSFRARRLTSLKHGIDLRPGAIFESIEQVCLLQVLGRKPV